MWLYLRQGAVVIYVAVLCSILLSFDTGCCINPSHRHYYRTLYRMKQSHHGGGSAATEISTPSSTSSSEFTFRGNSKFAVERSAQGEEMEVVMSPTNSSQQLPTSAERRRSSSLRRSRSVPVPLEAGTHSGDSSIDNSYCRTSPRHRSTGGRMRYRPPQLPPPPPPNGYRSPTPTKQPVTPSSIIEPVFDVVPQEEQGCPIKNKPDPLLLNVNRLVYTKPNVNYSNHEAVVTDSDVEDVDGEISSRLKFYLADRRYHLPGNGSCQDWIQFFLNNHPLLGMCCHHPLHPLKFSIRVVMLITSFAFGLGATSLVIIWYWYDDGTGSKLVTIQYSEKGEITITEEMVALFVFGSALHSAFDLMVWHIFACTLCQPGGPLEKYHFFKWIGQHIAGMICVVVIGISSGLVWYRATYPGDLSFHEFYFVLVYLVEMVLSLFVFNPLIGTILFSGVLGCYRIPILGGRPWEMRMEEAEKKRKEKKRLRALKASATPEQEVEFEV